jgi:hypothetical protein
MNSTRLVLMLSIATLFSVSAANANWDPNGKVDGYWVPTSVFAVPEGQAYAWVQENGNGDLSRTRTFDKVVLRSEYSGVVIGVRAGKQPAAPLELAADDEGNGIQQWNIVPTSADGRTVRLVNVASGMCAEVSLTQAPCKQPKENWSTQCFRLIRAGRGGVQIAPLNFPDARISATGDLGLTLLPAEADSSMMNWNILEFSK